MLPFFMAALAAAQTPVETADLRCHGGAMILFEPGSAQIDTAGVHRLEAFVIYWSRHGPPGMVRIEAGGDGFGRRFDADLSRRRSNAIRDYLARRDYRAREVTVVVGEELSRTSRPEDEDYARHMGWLAQRIPVAEYERLYPRNLIAECF